MNLPSSEVVDLLIHDFNLTRHMVSPEQDRSVMCPSPEWIENDFAPWLFQHCPAWQAESGDCDDIAKWAQVKAGESRRAAGGPPSGHAVFRAILDGRVGSALNGINFTTTYSSHATLIVLDNTRTWWFVEPATGLFCRAKLVLVDDNHPNNPVLGITYVDL